MMSSIPQHIGNYRLERRIGRGATSEVWLASHAYMEQRRVAIKILMSQDPETLQRFRREANLAGLLHHPNIVQVYDHGSYQAYDPPGQFHCTIMEYVHGGSLQHVLDRQRQFPLLDALDIFKQIAAALDYAHSLDVVHRDVAPGNVLMEQESGRAMLTDFGIARDLTQSITVDYAVMGTPGYWSPEHTRSATEVTHLSDIYGLGVLLYVMLTGALPWKEGAGTPYHTFGPPPPLKEHGISGMPPELDRVLQTLMAVDPAKRYASAGEAAEHLAHIVRRHHAATYMSGSLADVVSQTNGLDPDAVEQALGPDLKRGPIAQANQRADRLRQPGELAHLLNEWAARGSLRRKLLGRLARLHRISSRNLYFYRLRVLYEQRGQSETTREPDYHEQVFPVEAELGRWQVALPPIREFEPDAGGQVILTGSTRVVRCPSCEGRGKHICSVCKGKQRIYQTRPRLLEDEAEPAGTGTIQGALNEREAASSGPRGAARKQPALEQVLVPCPQCNGSGGITCEACDGVGRLVERSAFRWQRTPCFFDASSDLTGIDEKWLHRHCEMHEIYCERAGGSLPPGGPALRPEWSAIPQLGELIEQAKAAINDDTRMVLSEVSVQFIPISDIVFDLGPTDDEQDEAHLYRLTIYGFEQAIPSDWRFLNWERVLFLCITAFLVVLVAVFGYFALTS